MVDPGNYESALDYFSDLRFYDKEEFEFIEDNVPALEGALKLLEKESVVKPSTRGVYAVIDRNNNAEFESFHEINDFLQSYIEPFTGLNVRRPCNDAELDLSRYGEESHMYVKDVLEDVGRERRFEEEEEETRKVESVNHTLDDFNGHGIS